MHRHGSIGALGIGIAFCSAVIGIAAERPLTGPVVPELSPLDEVVNRFMDRIGAEAASLAIVENDRLVYARGYGWSDSEKTIPTQPDSMFRIGSNTKPVTAAIVHELIRTRRIAPTVSVIEFLGIQPFGGNLADPRLVDVTIQHLLEHRGGWDKDVTFDPMYRLDQIKKEMNLDSDLTAANVAEYMFAQPLQFTPGERRAYSNFGYVLLGLVIEKAANRSYDEAVQFMICRPLRVSDIRVSATKSEERDPREVYYPRESGLDMQLRQAAGGLAASAPSLCAFMQRYWINGEIRDPRERRSYYHSGSLPHSTTALMEQRRDGIDYVVLFNSRRNDRFVADNEELRNLMNQAIDQIKGGG